MYNYHENTQRGHRSSSAHRTTANQSLSSIHSARSHRTRGDRRSSTSSHSFVDILLLFVSSCIDGLISFCHVLLHAIAFAWGTWIQPLLKRSRPVRILCCVVLVCCAFCLVDYVDHYGKIYSGVTIGTVDCSNLTEAEAKNALDATYGQQVQSGSLNLYSSEDALNAGPQSVVVNDNESVEEARSKITNWTTTPTDLGATCNVDDVVAQAFAIGRDQNGLWERLALLFSQISLSPEIDYDDAAVDSFASQIDRVIGNPFQNADIEFDQGIAQAVEGHDGDMVDRHALEERMSQALLSTDEGDRSFVVGTVYTPAQISYQAAEQTASKVNAAIDQGVDLEYDGSNYHLDPATLGSYIQTDVVSDAGSYQLVASINRDYAKNCIIQILQPTFSNGSEHIAFSNDDSGNTQVDIYSSGSMPKLNDVLTTLDTFLNDASSEDTTPSIAVEKTDIPSQMSVEDALSYGIIAPISSYTTEYTSGVVARNTNIHLAADLLNNSIVKADNGEWSFNDTAGECNEDKGFLAAGAIYNDEAVDEIGGGICQVATTVFNAVYNAGFPITERTNHSLYIASYPAGRDAAISWPSPDLKWENDSSSDVLVRMTYTDSTVTATLYGVDPGYRVSTETGDWEQGATYQSVTKYDSNLASGQSYVKTKGVDGRIITIVRTVTDGSGSLLHKDTFDSTYAAQNEVTVEGTAES